MDDEEFIRRLVEKIERLTGTRVDVEVDRQDGGKLEIELNGENVARRSMTRGLFIHG